MSLSAPPGQSERGPNVRREQVRLRVLAEGYARLDDLAQSFGVSLMTMHRDIDVLAAEDPRGRHGQPLGPGERGRAGADGGPAPGEGRDHRAGRRTHRARADA